MVKVFLGNLPFGDDNVLEADIRAQFQKYGDIAEVILKKGFAFLSYLDERDAEDAVREMDNSDFGGRKIRVSFAHTEDSKRSGPQNGGSMDRAHDRAPPKEGCTSLFVGNIPPDTTIERVKTFFEQFGRVVNVKVLPQKTNNPNISAFIDFEQYGAAARAHEADLKYEGKFLRTDFSSNRR
ncbi:hypothetical protein H310_04169 [Aphanomyces invadans]|uniref:RRM domain-containing protein n=1 Tax=Aphanomyces invadans TaxID=157072 RepID=A0A024UH09_9STRA|nr:hypothetical protein H310_04169 [Aphanomyces invadans]ETW05167.1 hypothetical protein H310_04169 [Aphanomyces invadans]|eukprot:XP_008866605.1 hypothetical protein H310_04169 [Aphanomyces invadans]